MLGIKTLAKHKIIPYLAGSRVKMLQKNIFLAMTLLVKDEVDIIEKNILYHLSQGVDKIIVMDNGSTDGTVAILEKYKKLGKVDYFVNRENGFLQDVWVTRLIKIAIDKYKADFVINSDADEFWVPKYFNLKTMILIESDYDVISVPVRNYLPPRNLNIKNFNFENYPYYVKKTFGVPPKVIDRNIDDLWLYTYSNKLITSRKVTKIGFGNDTVKSAKKLKKILTTTIDIYHFPIRNYSHFEHKVINGGKALLSNPSKDMGRGWQWRQWYQIYLGGKLKEQYIKQTMADKLNYLINLGVIKKSVPGVLNVF